MIWDGRLKIFKYPNLYNIIISDKIYININNNNRYINDQNRCIIRQWYTNKIQDKDTRWRRNVIKEQSTSGSRNLFIEKAEIATCGWMGVKGDKGETRDTFVKDHCQNFVPLNDLLRGILSLRCHQSWNNEISFILRLCKKEM